MDIDLLRFARPLRRIPLVAWVFVLVGLSSGLLIARISLVNALLFTVLACIAVGSFLEPLIGIGAALFIGPLWAWLNIEFPQVPPLLGQYIFVYTLTAWVVRGLIFRDLHLPTPPFLTPLLGFMGIALLSLWNPVDVWVGFMEWAKWGQILLIYLLVYDRIRGQNSDRTVFVVVALIAGVALFQAVVGLWQFALRGDGPEHFAINARFYRAYGTFEQPNPFGGFMGMMASILIGIVFSVVSDWVVAKRRAYTSATHHLDQPVVLLIVTIGLACVTVGAVGASWSRGAWLGFGAAILAMVVVLPRRGGWGGLMMATLMISGFALYGTGLLPSAIADRLVGFLSYISFEDVRGVGIHDLNYAVVERMAHWQAALAMWRERFWLGMGFGCYEPAYPAYRLINWPIALGHAHNYYLNLLAETGLCGTVAFLVLFACILWPLLRATRQLTRWHRGLAIGLMGAWIHFLVHDFVDNLLVNNVHLHFGVLLALSAWLVTLCRDTDVMSDQALSVSDFRI